jgi:hypothetical protein
VVREAGDARFGWHRVEDEAVVAMAPAAGDPVLEVWAEAALPKTLLEGVKLALGGDLYDDVDIVGSPDRGAPGSVIHNSIVAPPTNATSGSRSVERGSGEFERLDVHAAA